MAEFVIDGMVVFESIASTNTSITNRYHYGCSRKKEFCQNQSRFARSRSDAAQDTFILLNIVFICISNVKTFPQFPLSPKTLNPSSHPLPPSICPSTQPTPTSPPRFPFVVASIEPSQDQGPLLPLMPDKTFLCHIFGWNHVYPLVHGLVPGSPGASGWPTLLFFPWG